MRNLISTETVVIISLLGKKVPNLLKYIVQYSTPKSGKKVAQKPTKVLSSQQIQEARQHRNTIVEQALKTSIAIQEALNITKTKIDELVKQRDEIENLLVPLLSANKQG